MHPVSTQRWPTQTPDRQSVPPRQMVPVGPRPHVCPSGLQTPAQHCPPVVQGCPPVVQLGVGLQTPCRHLPPGQPVSSGLPAQGGGGGGGSVASGPGFFFFLFFLFFFF